MYCAEFEDWRRDCVEFRGLFPYFLQLSMVNCFGLYKNPPVINRFLSTKIFDYLSKREYIIENIPKTVFSEPLFGSMDVRENTLCFWTT